MNWYYSAMTDTIEAVDIAGQRDIGSLMDRLGAQGRAAASSLARSEAALRDAAIEASARELEASAAAILDANAEDMAAARDRGHGPAMLDRLLLSESRVAAMAAALRAIAARPDPLGVVLAEWTRPNGLRIRRVSVPLGVIGIVYESRPNVTADAAALCLKSGNAAILRGGSESHGSNRAIHACLERGLAAAGLDTHAVQLVPVKDRAAVGYMLGSMTGSIDVVVPRGGRSLIERVQRDARVPVIGHLEGICHVYVHDDADAAMAESIVVNAKMRRTGICGAAETILVHRAAADALVPRLVAALSAAGCEVRGDSAVRAMAAGVAAATESDWRAEYLDAVVAMRVVDDLDAAIEHIAEYGSGHTESIVASSDAAAETFFRNVDSAILLHNASTQFADGGEFGMGAEIGIATGKIHARGPVGAEQLTSYKYLVSGAGQIRPA